MKNTRIYQAFLIIMTIFLCCAALIPAAAAERAIYINPEGEYVTTLKGLYAIGSSGGVSQLPEKDIWAATVSGTFRLGEDSVVQLREPVIPPTGEICVRSSVIKVGLDYKYGSRDSSQEKVSLQNYVGRGYVFGCFDDSRSFVALGSTEETRLTVVIDRNVSVSGGTIGCYHVRLPERYTSYEEALDAASAYANAFPAYYDGIFYVLVGQYQSVDVASAARAGIGDGTGEVFSASNRCVVVTKTGTTQILFEFDCGSTYSLAIRPNGAGGKAETTYTNKSESNRYYGDFQFIRTTGENMTVVNILPLEDYVKGVVPYEMSGSWPLEALKAQALCARTYVMRNYGSYASSGFDVTDDTYSQAYCGTRAANYITDQAVDETAGLYVTYNGELCETLYFSSDGGATEDSENIFSTRIPYLRGVIDPYEASIDFPNKTWSEELTADQLAQRLRSRGYNLSTIASVKAEYTDIGNMGRLTFTDVNGRSVSVAKTVCYSCLGLKSIHFTIEEKYPGVYRIEGGGWGHNVGMSQWGANAMASEYGYSFAHIIGFYYTDVTISRGIVSG